jgi:hypothetical protein
MWRASFRNQARVTDPRGPVRHVWCGAEVRRASRVFERRPLRSGTVTAFAALRSSSDYRARWKTLQMHARSNDSGSLETRRVPDNMTDCSL